MPGKQRSAQSKGGHAKKQKTNKKSKLQSCSTLGHDLCARKSALKSHAISHCLAGSS